MAEPAKFGKVLNQSYVIIVCTYVSIGVVGYVAYGSSVNALITVSFKGWLATISQALFIITMICKVSITLNPVATDIQELLKGETSGKTFKTSEASGETSSQWEVMNIFLRSFLLLLVFFTASSLPDFGFAVGLVGSILSMILVVIIPVACYLVLFSKTISCFSKGIGWLILLCAPVTAAAMIYQLWMNHLSG